MVDSLLEARGLDTVLIVTDPYHALRSRLIAEELGLTAYVSPTPTSVVTGTKAVERHLAEAAGVGGRPDHRVRPSRRSHRLSRPRRISERDARYNRRPHRFSATRVIASWGVV